MQQVRSIPQQAQLEVPRHVGIIPDGHRRWGERNNGDALSGQVVGAEKLLPVLEAAAAAGVEKITLLTFSTESWMRPDEEVNLLMRLFARAARENSLEARRKGIRMNFVGRREELPTDLQDAIRECEEVTQSGTRLSVSVALNYSGQAELVDAARSMVSDGLSPEEITGHTFNRYLYEPESADMDLVIRTGGELRLSNFALWQTSFAEFYSTETLWPDFTPEEFERTLRSYSERDRRYGQ